MAKPRFTRRMLIAGAAPLVAAGPLAKLALGDDHPESAHLTSGSGQGHEGMAAAHGGGNKGPTFKLGDVVDHEANGFNPTEILRDFDYGTTRRLPGGRLLREYTLVAEDKEIEVAPGVRFPAWTFNGRVPGPTLRATEGDLMRVRFVNTSEHPHTVHFHGFHPPAMDGVPGIGAGLIDPGKSTTYEFEAEPFGLHLYHCHVGPLAEHIARGLYGAFVCDPKQGRAEADELVMVMNGFNTNFDFEGNQLYAVNTVAFHHVHEPIQVKQGELVRIYLVNTLEFDPINSFHTHATFFDYYPTGTRLEPVEFTDTVVLGQAQRGICELRFKHSGLFMFHAHKTEFADLGWMGFFEVE